MKDKLKTWGGIVLMILGAIGVTDKLGFENVSNIIDSLLVIIGIVLDIISTRSTEKTVATLKRGY